MGQKQSNVQPVLFVQLIFLIVFLALALFAEYWFSVVWPHPWGEDFFIYYRAFLSARAWESAYFPYGIGGSFVYNPSALTIVSLFSLFGLPGEFVASLIWGAANLSAYLGAVWLGLKLFSSKSQPLLVSHKLFIAAMFFLFAPVWEMIHIGQINGLVLVCLVGTLVLSEKGLEGWAGVVLALAIVLKTTPIILLGYFLLTRRWKTVLAGCLALAGLSFISWLQFGSLVFADFFDVLPLLTNEMHPNFFNHSLSGTILRLGLNNGTHLPGELVVNLHRQVMLSLIGLAILSGWFIPRHTDRPRWVLYALLMALMTVASSLVWYHHNVFLMLPLLLLLMGEKRWHWLTSLGLMLLIQIARFYEYLLAPLSDIQVYAGLTVIAAQLGLIVFLGVIYVQMMIKAQQVS